MQQQSSASNIYQALPVKFEKFRRAQLIFSTPDQAKGEALTLHLISGETPTSPTFVGMLDDMQVVAFIRNDPRGSRLYLCDPSVPIGASKSKKVATARVVTNSVGQPKLALTIEHRTVWADIEADADQALLVRCGLDLERSNARQLAHLKPQAAKAIG